MEKINKKEKNANNFLIVGYGKFGQGFANRLLEEGIKESRIYIIDKSEEWARKAASIFSNVYQANADDFDRLDSAGININDINIIVIAMADIEDSLMIASNRKKYADKIFYAKAKNDIHKRLLKTLGIDEVVIPEQEIGSKLAYKCLFKNNVEISDISTSYNIIHFKITSTKFISLPISELNLREKFDCNIFGIKRNNHFFIPSGKEVIMKNDTLSVVCLKEDTKKLLNFFYE